MESATFEHVELQVSDHAQLGALQEYLRLAVPDVRVLRDAGQPGPHEQGALDVLTMLAGGSGLIAAIKVLPEFLRSRRTGVSITMTIKDQPFTLTATNIDEVMPILERLLDA